MGYKVLGFLVWQGGKWYVRRRVTGGGRKLLAVAGLGAAVAGAAIAAQQRGARGATVAGPGA